MTTIRSSASLIAIALAAGCTGEPVEDIGERTAALTPVTWTDVVGASATGSDLTKTAPETAFNAGAVSVETLSGDGFVEFTTGEATTDKAAGLSSGNGGQSLADIDFAVRLNASGLASVWESGVNRGGIGPYAAGDLFRVQAEGGVVTYWRNGGLAYTSALAPGFPLLVDTSLRTPGATITDVAIESFQFWTDAVRVAVGGRDITKTGLENAWNAGAISVDTIDSDGYVEFRPGDAVSDVVAGLSRGNGNASRAEIDHGIELGADGKFGVVENGTFIRNFGTYVSSDSFQVQVAGGVVTYLKGRFPFYTSTVTPAFPLLLDSSIRTPGASILDGRMVSGEVADSCLAPQQTLTGESLWSSWQLDAAGDVMVWTEYRNSPGVVRVFRRGSDGWALERRFVRADWGPNFWGTSATDGQTIAVAGGPRFDDGFVVVFRHDEGRWNQEAVLTGCPDTSSIFVRAAVQGDVLVASGLAGGVGRLLVYRRDATGAWPLEAVLTPADGAGLGVSMGVGDERIFTTLGSANGVAVFRYNPALPDPAEPPSCTNLDPGKWRQRWTLLAPPEHRFDSMDVNRDGSRFVAADDAYLRRGDLHVFSLVAGDWSEITLLPYPRDRIALGGHNIAFGGSNANADSLLATSASRGFLFRAIGGGGYTQIARRSNVQHVALAQDTYFRPFDDGSGRAVEVQTVNPVCTAE